MTQYQPSDALLRTRIVSRAPHASDDQFENGQRTRPASRVYEKQASARAAERIVRKSRRPRVSSEQRSKEIQRRRKWAGGGNMPPEIRAEYSEAERAALSVIAERCRKKGFCDLCLDEIARLAGVGRTTVQNAIRKARAKERGHISVRERPQQSGKNLTNIIKIISKSWCGWILRAIGFKRLSTSVTQVKTSLFESAENENSAFERACAGSVGSPFDRHGQRQARPGENSSRWWRSRATASV